MIKITNLNKSFHADYSAICNLNCVFDDQPWAIVGSEMSGKTTLLNIIAGLDLAYEGEVLIDGVDRKVLDNKNIQISYITKNPTLFESKSVYDNLYYVFKVAGDKREREILDAEIKTVAEEFRIFGILDKKAKRCSLFEKRLVCVARAVLKKTSIILADEPFSDMYNFEIASLWQAMLFAKDKLSSMLIVAENTQNMALFYNMNVLKLDFGVKIE